MNNYGTEWRRVLKFKVEVGCVYILLLLALPLSWWVIWCTISLNRIREEMNKMYRPRFPAHRWGTTGWLMRRWGFSLNHCEPERGRGKEAVWMDYYYENTTMGEYMYVCTLTPYRKTMKTFLPLSLYLRYCWDCYVTS